jgi:hypothetical protein
MKDRLDSVHLDANETIWFVEELNCVKSKAYQKKYPQLKGANGMLFPISREADPADETITYVFFDETGIAAFISNYGDDLPAVDVHGKRFTSNIRGIGDHYEYSLLDVRKGAKTGKSLTQRKANAARKAIDEKLNRVAWYGDDEYGIVGFLDNPNITATEVSTGAVSGNKKFADKNPDEILLDMNKCIYDTKILTNSVESPNVICLPVEQHAIVATTRMASGTDTTILEFFKKNNPSVEVVEVVELKNVNPLPSGATGPKDVMFSFVRDEDHITFEMPQPFEQLPVQQKNMAFRVNCHARTGGVINYYPLAVNVVEGI